jgi:hypothetical protein
MSYTIVESTKTKVNNVTAVQDILDNYWCGFEPQIEPEHAGTGTLTLAGWDADPQAVHVDQWPDDEEYPDEDDWDDAMQLVLEEKGNEGFVAMLRELAPYLQTPLTVVWHSIFEGHFGGAGQWTVQPGSPDVQVQEVFPLA